MITDTRLLAEEASIPHMLSLIIHKLYSEGFEIRMDVRDQLDTSMRGILMKNPQLALTAAKEADAMATDILKTVGFDDSKTALLATAYYIIKLVDEGLVYDPNQQAVLAALMITVDADEDENPELHNVVKIAKEKASMMVTKALEKGMFNMTRVST